MDIHTSGLFKRFWMRPEKPMRLSTKSIAAVFASPVGILFLAGFLWSFSGILIKLLNCNAFVIAGARGGIAAIVQFAYLWSIGAKVQLPKGPIQWLGVAAFVSNIFLLVFAFQLTSAANAVFLHYSGIILVAFVAPRLLKENTTKYDCLAVCFALAGIYLLVGTQLESKTQIGNILGVFCGITFAVMQLCWRYVGKTRNHIDLINVCLISDVITFLVSIITVTFFAPAGNINLSHNWSLFIALGIIPWALPNILECCVIGKVQAVKAMIATMLDPLFTAIWPMLILSEFPTVWGYTGCALILAAIVVSQYTELKAQKTLADISSRREDTFAKVAVK